MNAMVKKTGIEDAHLELGEWLETVRMGLDVYSDSIGGGRVAELAAAAADLAGLLSKKEGKRRYKKFKAKQTPSMFLVPMMASGWYLQADRCCEAVRALEPLIAAARNNEDGSIGYTMREGLRVLQQLFGIMAKVPG
jgi:hypothetical protein